MDENVFSIDGARAAAANDELAHWVREFLRSPGSDNAVLADDLFQQDRSWIGPVELRFDELNRLAGPADQPALAPLGDDDLERVDHMEKSLDDGWEPPPLIVTHHDGEFTVEDGNHRTEGLRQAGRDRYWSVVGFDDDDARDGFLARVESAPVAGAPSDNTDLSAVLNTWDEHGFSGQFIGLEGGRIECVSCGDVSRASQFEVVEWRRLEGASDPDDMMNTVAAHCPACGAGGTLILGYGVNASDIDVDLSTELDLRHRPVQVPHEPETAVGSASDGAEPS